MKFKEVILTLFLGIIIGVGLSPLTKANPKEAIMSPVSLTLAKIKKLTLPTNEENVLGVSRSNKKEGSHSNKKPQDSEVSQFGLLVSSPSAVTAKNKKSKTTSKSSFTPSLYAGQVKVAVFGDSMVDVMGTNLPSLHASLQNYYPRANLQLFNYGMGAQNIEQGLNRLGKEYNYKDRHHPSLNNLNPDIVVLGSFSYNPFKEGEDELYRHWANLASLVGWVRNNTSAEIILLAEIAPNKEKFGQGPNGVNWDQDTAWQHANLISQYLENTVKFGRASGLPLADAYHKTLLPNGEGNLMYINPNDHIHQNAAGNSIMAQLLSSAIYNLGLFK